MKYSVLVFFILFFVSVVHSQECKSFNDYKAEGKDVTILDSLYPAAMHIDSNLAVFHGREQEFFLAWKTMLQDLATYLDENEFYWGGQMWCFNRVYFSPNGKVDTYLFKFKEDTVDEEKQKAFAALLSDFTSDYTLKIDSAAKSQFAQCGPVTYLDKEN